MAQGGGSFGRHLFADAAFEAAAISQKLGKPVKLMWHRTDNFRQGRVHPMVTSRVRALCLGGNVLTFDQRNTSVATDWSHGFGELLSATGATLPRTNLGYSRVDLRPDRERALRLRRRHPAAQRDLRVQHVQHQRRPQRLQPRGDDAARADGRPAGEGDGAGPLPIPARLRQGQPDAGGARQGGPGRELGPRDGARHRPGASASTASTRATAPAWSRSTAGRRRSTARSRTRTRARG